MVNYISYKVYQNCPEATNYSKERAIKAYYLGGIFMVIAVISFILYLVAARDLFSGETVGLFWISLSLQIACVFPIWWFFIVWPLRTDKDCEYICNRPAYMSSRSKEIDAAFEKHMEQCEVKYKTTLKKATIIVGVIYLSVLLLSFIFVALYLPSRY